MSKSGCGTPNTALSISSYKMAGRTDVFKTFVRLFFGGGGVYWRRRRLETEVILSTSSFYVKDQTENSGSSRMLR